MIAPAMRILPDRRSAGAGRSLLVERNLLRLPADAGWSSCRASSSRSSTCSAIGFGLGALVGTVPGPDGQPISYSLFVAPALLAVVGDERRDLRQHDQLLLQAQATPRRTTRSCRRRWRVGDVALGEIAWALIRGTLYAIGFMVVMLRARPGLRRRSAILAFPAAMLIGFAFAGGRHGGDVVHAHVAGLRPGPARGPADVPVQRHVLPAERVPAVLATIIQFTPLYRSMDLIRGLTTGVIGPSIVLDIGYLLAMGLIGLAIVSRRLDKLLLP